jgi:hypothetical protein
MAVTPTARFVPNPSGIAAIARSLEVQNELRTIAESVASNAEGLAPVDEGDYRDSIEVDVTVDGGEAVAIVKAGDWKAGWIEFGASSPTYTMPAHAPLRRGAEQAGLKVVSR